MSDARIGERIGPYVVRGELGRGGMATVLEVTHAETGEVRALKLLSGSIDNEESQRRFDTEFRTLASLDHPNITRVFDAGVEDGQAWFVMEKLQGRDLRDEVKAWRGLAPTERFEMAQSVLVQVAEALAYIHERGLVHRDVTPGNIMVSPDGRVRLMDFGVVHTPGAELTVAGEMVGTVAYIAPEQISPEINGGRVDARTDLYALGVVLYQMLVGRRPFNATTIPSLLEKHRSSKPRPPREVLPTVPRHLNDVCLRLLEKDPAQRYGTAQHLLAVLRRRTNPQLDMRAWPPRLVGRTTELSALREALSALAKHQRGQVLLFEGPSGFGKSSLLVELSQHARALDLRTAEGVCGPDSSAFSGFRGILNALSSFGVPIPPLLDDGAQEGELEPYPVMVAWRDLLRDAAPLVLSIDNLHLADRGTNNLIEFLVRNLLHLANVPILLVMTRQPTEGDDPLLGLLRQGAAGVTPQHLIMQPIPATAVEELLLELVPDDDRTRTLARRLHREGEGNPHFISEMIRGLVEEGVIFEDEDGYRLGMDRADVTRATLPIPVSIRAALKERLEALSPSALRTASLIALCHQEVTFDVLLEALGTHEDLLLAVVEELVNKGVVRGRQVGMDETYDLGQARMRDILVEEMDPLDRATLHRRMGATMERVYRQTIPSVVETLAYHFEHGQMAAKAYPYLVRAGIRLWERSFVPEALAYFDRALALEHDAREFLILMEADRQLANLRIHRGLALHHLGRWDEAEKEFRLADNLAMDINDEELRARALMELGDFARRQHRIEDAEAYLTEALTIANRLGLPNLRVDPLHGLGTVRWYRGDMEGARQYWLEALAVGGAVRNDRALGQGYNGLGLVAFCRGQAAEARKYLEQSCHIFEKLGKLDKLAVSRVNLVELYHCMGNVRKGIQIADRTIAQSREIHHQWGIALGLRYRSMLLLDMGRVAEARENADEALRLTQEINDPEEELAAMVSLIRIALVEGDWEQLSDHLDRADQLNQYDSEGFKPLLYAWRGRLLAQLGRHEEMQEALNKARDEMKRAWPHQQCRLDIITARALELAGQPVLACEHAEASLRRADSCGFRFYSLKAHVLVARTSTDPEKVERHLRVARALARSLTANLPREDINAFIAVNQVPAEERRR